MKRITLLSLGLFCTMSLFAQDEIFMTSIKDSGKISRSDWQSIYLVEGEQKKIDFADGIKDNFLNIDEDITRSKAISKAVFEDVQNTLYYIVNNFDNQLFKRDALTTLSLQLKNLNKQIDRGSLNINYYKKLLSVQYDFLRALHRKQASSFIAKNASPELFALSPIVNSIDSIKQALVFATADQYPELLLPSLKSISPESLADEIVSKASRTEPKMILNYATSTAAEREIVRRNKDKYVVNLVQIADQSKTPLKAIFFINELNEGRIKMSEINAITENRGSYFKKLSALMLNAKGENKMLGRELDQESKYYVHLMNELHDASEGTRFACIKSFNAEETYYIMVYGDDEFYTSSYLGVFKRLMERMNPKNGYSFLEKMNFVKFRTFIRLNGNYNTLSPFLATLKNEDKNKLMANFVSNLEESGDKSLEGAIDVANTFSSIKDSTLQNLVIEEVQRNRSRCNLADNKYGFRIYNILNTMFTGTAEEISKELNIPPISSVTRKGLENDSGEVVHQIFFPGDTDGKGVFKSFLSKHAGWKITTKEKWVEIASRSGAKIIKYANKPFDEPNDEFAQDELQAYLDANNIKPSVVIQRGHSYHVQNTLDHLNAHHKIVILGACGGFNHLETIMTKSPDAQIISSKQIGSGSINWPILNYLDAELGNGRDIDWVKMWETLGKQLRGNELFDDYVPPHKNLGSLFLKAYYRAELEE